MINMKWIKKYESYNSFIEILSPIIENGISNKFKDFLNHLHIKYTFEKEKQKYNRKAVNGNRYVFHYQNEELSYEQSVYGFARFLNDYLQGKLGATEKTKFEHVPLNTDYIDPDNIDFETYNHFRNQPENNHIHLFYGIFITIAKYKDIKETEDLIKFQSIDVWNINLHFEYSLKYMEHGQEYSKIWNDNIKLGDINALKNYVKAHLIIINDELDKQVDNFNEHYNIKKEYLEIFNKYLENGNQLEIIGNIKNYEYLLKELGLTKEDAQKSDELNVMGFGD